jgi:ectoine hydroxylase-related dioxygenase (phytanoyl-CoA dioxygenase family)
MLQSIPPPMQKAPALWLDAKDCRVPDLQALLNSCASQAYGPSASETLHGVPVYDCALLRKRLSETGPHGLSRQDLMGEWIEVFNSGPGILVMRKAWDNLEAIDEATAQFQAMVEAERSTGSGGDHFAKAGANDRVWNALEKLCIRNPHVFAHYYANDMLALVCEAWLGPAYQVTSQVNCVNPGGAAQMAHRDYHLGFMKPEQAQRYAVPVHHLSPFLTLQGAVAHVDMPLESGPTLYLPHSQKYLPGYLVAGQPEFQVYFDAHHVQLPLRKGDAVFFNPALIHAAGHNRSSGIRRMANLLQVSSAFGRAMETVDRVKMCEALYPTLQAQLAAGQLTPTQAGQAVAACAEGYAFPTNLDRDPPLGGLAPTSQQAMMLQALTEKWRCEDFVQKLRQQAEKKL